MVTAGPKRRLTLLVYKWKKGSATIKPEFPSIPDLETWSGHPPPRVLLYLGLSYSPHPADSAKMNPNTTCYTVVHDDLLETPSTQDLRNALQKGSDEVKLETMRRIIVGTLNGQSHVRYHAIKPANQALLPSTFPTESYNGVAYAYVDDANAKSSQHYSCPSYNM